MSTLQIRLKNCIQTILDLEPDMRAGIWGRHFDEELSTLKDYLQRVDRMNLAEDDVQRLENATASFLAELRLFRRGQPQQKRLLQ
ncbi:hypothetical protein HMPREF1022_00322 [Desulfovibrio sp. 6_1_46AFAA]|uniref:hypothetical protein n=1 Tax=unclassified Desulfovibrio TaxID=2593640 RepID=UPI0001E128D4|nr:MULTISPECIES: hypothetical protein [unclassified Desulfovibrio]EFL85706.1 hypothetical protein HMPREF0326_01409 [Desulfovibrio sp. 3_1_syn3]EGW52726.1 hypothetical protein HMPREF1022_00322 [Desulfovibrio sp. 6_1_46AFAA]